MPSEPTVYAPVGAAFAEGLRQAYGVDARPMFAAVGVRPEALTDAGGRIPVRVTPRLWELAVEATGDEDLGLVLGQHLKITSTYSVGFGFLASATLRDAIQRLIRYGRVVTSAVALELSRADGKEILYYNVANPDVPPHPQAIVAGLVGLKRLCGVLVGPKFRLAAVDLAQGSRPSERYEAIFEAPVRFSAGHNALHLYGDYMDTPLPGENKELAFQNDQIAERYLASLDPNETAARVRQMLIELLPTGEASQEAVASRMHKSLSTLQRSLKADGTTYRELLEDTRQSLARQYIKEGRYNLGQIAYMLGFSDQSNFSRAFKRWTGESPREFRG